MGTITYSYDILQDVYVIDTIDNIKYVSSATIIKISYTANSNTTELKYDVRLKSYDVKTFNESDIFASKAAAMTAYNLLEI